MENGIAKMVSQLVLVRDDGLWLVGEVSDRASGTRQLEPFYELHMQVMTQFDQRTRQPVGQQIVYSAQPLLLAEGFGAWTLSKDAPTWFVDDLSIASQIKQAVAQAEQIVKQMRAARAGIALASSVPRIRSK